MNITFYCIQCAVPSQGQTVSRSAMEVQDSGIYEVVCPKGHRGVVLFQCNRFQLLFQIGCFAILDGYYREAINSFAGASERFFEFYTRVIAVQKKVPEQELAQTWKELANRSERQLGAFLACYLLENGRHFSLNEKKMAELRNKVVHKGIIPTKEEALEFGQYTFIQIAKTIVELKASSKAYMDKVELKEMTERFEEAKKKYPEALERMRKAGMGPITAGAAVVLDYIREDFDKVTFEESMRTLPGVRQSHWS